MKKKKWTENIFPINIFYQYFLLLFDLLKYIEVINFQKIDHFYSSSTGFTSLKKYTTAECEWYDVGLNIYATNLLSKHWNLKKQWSPRFKMNCVGYNILCRVKYIFSLFRYDYNFINRAQKNGKINYEFLFVISWSNLWFTKQKKIQFINFES